jgi:hypothetical protein
METYLIILIYIKIKKTILVFCKEIKRFESILLVDLKVKHAQRTGCNYCR